MGRWPMRKRLRLVALISVGALAAAAGGCSNSDDRDPAASTSSASVSSGQALSLVVIGDSIPYNSPDDCPGCTGFVDRYAKALAEATGRKVETSNLSEHTGLTLPQLMQELDSFKEPLSGADAIIVGIAHNSFGLNNDEQCG